jgi:hypothetical protein
LHQEADVLRACAYLAVVEKLNGLVHLARVIGAARPACTQAEAKKKKNTKELNARIAEVVGAPAHEKTGADRNTRNQDNAHDLQRGQCGALFAAAATAFLHRRRHIFCDFLFG